jgi:Domain of unknown function (DUF932)
VLESLTDLDRYKFPVEETNIYVNREEKGKVFQRLAEDYKAIIRSDNKKLISVMPKTYRLVSNKDLIENLLSQLEKIDSKFYIDSSHSFVSDRRMRLQLTFPELTIDDDESKTNLSLFIHNSYDGSEGVRLFWGAIRGICSNGMVFGKLLSQAYRKHTKGLNLPDIQAVMDKGYKAVPEIQRRFDAMQRLEIMQTDKLKETIEEEMGKKISNDPDLLEVLERRATEWEVFQALTYIVSHKVRINRQAFYQRKISKLMNI